MNRTLIALLIVGLLGWLISLPSDLPQAYLDQYKGARLTQEGVSVGGACESDKCLVVYVAPWCPACKSLTPMINDLSAELDKEGIKASIVIGKDSMDNVLDYSKRFNQKVLIDSSGRYFNEIGAKGVPYFAVTNQSGKRIEEMSGGYREVRHMREQLGI